MSENRAVTKATPAQVWAVLSDPYSYGDWVVGAKTIRRVEGNWPKVGATIHHTVGAGPANLKDTTAVVEEEPCRRLRLRARFRPIGVAQIFFELNPTSDGTEVVMVESVVGGPAARFYGRLMSIALKVRNVETLRRLTALAEKERVD